MLRRTDWATDAEDGTQFCDFYIVSETADIPTSCPVESHDHSKDDFEEEYHHFDSAMCCANCLTVVAKKDDIIPEQITVMKEATYQYDLDLLGISSRCYSATNEHGNRFDVSRFKPSISNVSLTTETSDKHSWFPGYLWSIASCAECGHHLGWGFNLVGNPPEFIGLVVTSLRESYIPEKAYMRHVARARRDGGVRLLLKCIFAGSVETKDRVIEALKRS